MLSSQKLHMNNVKSQKVMFRDNYVEVSITSRFILCENVIDLVFIKNRMLLHIKTLLTARVMKYLSCALEKYGKYFVI